MHRHSRGEQDEQQHCCAERTEAEAGGDPARPRQAFIELPGEDSAGKGDAGEGENFHNTLHNNTHVLPAHCTRRRRACCAAIASAVAG